MSKVEKKSDNLCPCCSGKEYLQCCKPLHQGGEATDPLGLMRSRFSAYALNLPDYIIRTTHPASSSYSDNKFSWKRGISQFSKGSLFQKLVVLDFKESGSMATVTFTAYISQQGKDATFTEKSYFEKMKGQWLYRGGQLVQGHVPNLVTTGQLRLLPVAYYGDPVLRRKADLISEITPSIMTLVEEMIETMEASNGIGIAAPQVHHSIRLFIIRKPTETEDGEIEFGDIEVFINPMLSSPSDERWKTTEGCISIPILRAEVERPKEVTIDYTNLEGESLQRVVNGWEARMIMHEYDHIEGILFIDRLPEEEQLKFRPFLDNLQARICDARAF